VAFRTFQARLLALFLGLFAVVLVAAFLLVNAAHTRNARRQIDDALEVGAGVFHRLIAERTARLVEAARLLSGDFAFKAAYADGDRDTIGSALANHRARIGADVMLLASLDYEIVADTRRRPPPGAMLELAGRIDRALEGGETELADVVSLDGLPFQVVVVPLLAPAPEAWICVGFRIDDEFAASFRRLTLSHVSLLVPGPAGWDVVASTLPGEARADLPAALRGSAWEADRSLTLPLGGEAMVSLVTPLGDAAAMPVLAVLQRSLSAALRPFLRLRAVLASLFGAGLAVCLALGTLIARSVSRPVREVAAAARRVEQGDYGLRLAVRGRDEIAEMAGAFNHMAQGLAERDRVRSLLGRVVSPAIAHELLRKEIELGGEERPVTVLFADVRGFTTMCEGIPPQEIVWRLNRYLTRMTAAVEAEEGVIDKYIGDAVMALFGAPLAHADDAARAVRAALGMHREMAGLNREFRARGMPEMAIGVGVNSGTVVAGNMGSATRLNYTVIGDGVNLASRLEGLTKQYGLPVVVSEATRAAAPEFLYREIDRVRVRGRSEAVTVHEPLGPADGVPEPVRAAAAEFAAALAAYRARAWDEAERRLRRLAGSAPAERLYRVYRERVAACAAREPAPDWDGSHTLDLK
jgi:adenylate cyclase